MRTKSRIKLFLLLTISLFPLLYIVTIGKASNVLLIITALVLFFIISWIAIDLILIDDYIRLSDSNTLKSKYIFIASHDLRTPMTAIKGLISMIADGDYGPVNKELSEPLSDIGVSVERLIGLMNDLLTLSRVGDNRLKFDIMPIEIKKQIEEVVDLLSPAAKEKNISIDSSHCSTLSIQADPEKFNHILNVLIQYLLTHTHEKQIYIVCHAKDNAVFVCITDTEDISTIRGKSDLIPDGANLNYYIAKEFTKKMGEEVQFHTSKDRKKMAFTFLLPLSCRDGET